MRIAIASGKGGTGKTTLAVNLALKAAETMSTMLIDLDVEEPNGGIFIQAEEYNHQEVTRAIPVWDQKACNLCGQCSTWCRYNAIIKLGDTIMVMPQLCHSCYACSELCPMQALPMQEQALGVIKHFKLGQLDFIESKLNVGLEQASPLIAQSLNYVDEHFADVSLQILDSPPGTACAMVSAVKTADYVILISEPTPFGVINRDGIGNNDIYEYLNQEQIPLLAKIPHQREIAELYSRGEILYRKIPAIDQALTQILSAIRSNS